jgi:hypothetical protein
VPSAPNVTRSQPQSHPKSSQVIPKSPQVTNITQTDSPSMSTVALVPPINHRGWRNGDPRAPKVTSSHPKSLQSHPKSPQSHPKRPQCHPKSAPKSPQVTPESPQVVPKSPQVTNITQTDHWLSQFLYHWFSEFVFSISLICSPLLLKQWEQRALREKTDITITRIHLGITDLRTQQLFHMSFPFPR